MLENLNPCTLIELHYHKWSATDKEYIEKELVDPADDFTMPSEEYVAVVPLWLCHERYMDLYYKVLSVEVGTCVSPATGVVEGAIIVHLKEQ